MSEEMKECLINGLVTPPYAGSYLFYLMTKMKEIQQNSDLFKTWLKCVKNVQIGELKSF